LLTVFVGLQDDGSGVDVGVERPHVQVQAVGQRSHVKRAQHSDGVRPHFLAAVSTCLLDVSLR
jgi:hypothetical protein